MSRSVVVEQHIQLADFYELRFEDRTLPEIGEQVGWLPFLQRLWSNSVFWCESSTLLYFRRGTLRSLVWSDRLECADHILARRARFIFGVREGCDSVP
ncbi:hypothetical protein CJ030_MR7G001541 [Morella rubra]|uniref:Uncharacterized protein n=1 Tax=Morella rubra TaxID=262757 RepID=A0A6A1V1X5_9ROSI|nr:hypothetical protein CJ030_MR7G001541 [Morella rubra]